MALAWDGAAGVGYLPVQGHPYDDAYFAKYERYAATDLGKTLDALRTDLVNRHAGPAASVIDVGIGCGAFIEARQGPTYGYDINPAAVVWLKDRFLFRDPHEQPADALTFFDSLEHIARPDAMLANAREWVFVALPIVPGDGPPDPEWRHYRPDEHCWYWTRDGFTHWMRRRGFVCVEHGTPESDAGRLDIHTFAFRRVRHV